MNSKNPGNEETSAESHDQLTSGNMLRQIQNIIQSDGDVDVDETTHRQDQRVGFGANKPYSISCTKKYIHLIRQGHKSVEGRLCYHKFRNIRPGSLIRLFYRTHKHDDVVCQVVSTHIYKTFEEMLMTEGVANCVPGETDLGKAVEIYRNFPNNAKYENKLGVIAFRIKYVYSNQVDLGSIQTQKTLKDYVVSS